ncbi:AraC family transcriptional regulator [Sagittula stellata]|uniref:AraC family transcriptional regulator n=1 Tax=Sagittula stellata TaxID=52603 RepID=UPI00321B80B8
MVETGEYERARRIQTKILRGILNGARLDDAESLLAAEGMNLADLRDEGGTMPFAAYLRLFDRIAEAQGRESFGLELSTGMGPELVGPAGYIFAASPDLAHAVRSLSSSVFTIQDATAFDVHDSPAPHVRYRITDDDLTPRRQDVEFSLGYVDRLIRLLLGPGYAPSEVWFEHARPARLGAHEAVFRAPVFFDQEMNAIWFQPVDMTRRAPGHDPNLVALMQHYIQLLAQRSHAIGTWTEEVRQVLAGQPGGAELETVCRQLGVSPATLGRRLRDEGTTFRDLGRRHRIERAARMLSETRLSVLEVALRAGYGETASFTRAFRDVMGPTPRNWRNNPSPGAR